MERLSWITWVGLKCNHLSSYKEKALGDFRNIHMEEGEAKTEQRRFADGALKTGAMWPQAKECQLSQKLAEAYEGILP